MQLIFIFVQNLTQLRFKATFKRDLQCWYWCQEPFSPGRQSQQIGVPGSAECKRGSRSWKPNWCGKLRRNDPRVRLSHQRRDLSQPSSAITAAGTDTPASDFTATTDAVPRTPKVQLHAVLRNWRMRPTTTTNLNWRCSRPNPVFEQVSQFCSALIQSLYS